jgi:acyl transferase domain-containing protein
MEHKIFHQILLELLEDSRFSTSDLANRFDNDIGLYLGAMVTDPSTCSPTAIANRLSTSFGMHGPCIAIDTMSSSALTALHLACDGLNRGDCDLAIVMGVHFLTASDFLFMSKHRMLASNTNSRSFSSGDGFLPAEAIGAVMLRPLSQAISDRDNILAVIRSTALGHAGSGLPNQKVLRKVLEKNFANASIEQRSIGYVEASANGTQAVDALEMKALVRVFQNADMEPMSCAVGSVKSNIGHAVGASGMSQLTKVVLQMIHKTIAPSIIFEPTNPEIDFQDTPFYLNRHDREWAQIKRATDSGVLYPRRAIINSFGAGGTYGSIVVEEAPPAAMSMSGT